MPFAPLPLTVAVILPPLKAMSLSLLMPLVSSAATLSTKVPALMNVWPLNSSSGSFVADTSMQSPCTPLMLNVPPSVCKYCSTCMPSLRAEVTLNVPKLLLNCVYSSEA